MVLSNGIPSPQIPDQSQSSVSLSLASLSTPETPIFAVHQAPKIIRQLGEQLSIHTAEAPLNEIQLSHVQDFEKAKAALQQMLTKTNQIYKKCEIGKSTHLDITHLADKIGKLESQLLGLKTENKLSSAEVEKLQEFTKQLQIIISALGKWTDFQSAYFACDDRCEEALACVSSIVFSHLHGCSPVSVQGVMEALHSLHQQIELCAAQLTKQDHTFTPAVWNQIAGAILSTTSNVEDWCHELSVRSGPVFQQSLDLWDKAETFEEKQEAASLLLSQQRMFQGLEASIDELEKLMRRSLKQLPAQTGIDPAKYLQIQGQLRTFTEALASLKAAIPAKRQFADAEILERSVVKEITKARSVVDREIIEARVAQILEAYVLMPEEEPEHAIEHYIAIKRALLPYTGFSKAVKAFCRQEEVRLTALAGYVTDFEGMAHAALLKDKEPPLSFLGSIYRAIHPDNWSDRRKGWIRTTFNVVQLGSHLLNIYQQAPRLPDPSLSSQDRGTVDKELNLLRALVTTNKYKVLGNQAAFEQLTKKTPEIREALQEFIRYSSAPSKELQNQFFAKYEAYRHDVLLGKEVLPPSQWVSQLEHLNTSAYRATILPKFDQLKLRHTAEAAEKALQATVMSMTPAKSGVEQLQAASQAMQASRSLIRQCSLVEYMQPKRPVTPQALLELKQEVARMQHCLREAMLSQPQSTAGPEWAAWNTAVSKQCFAARDLEKYVNQAMEKYEEAMALGSFQKEAETALSVFGNKHLNLIRQANLQSTLEMGGIEIPVPEGVESNQVHRFLQATVPELFTHWHMLGKLYADYQEQEPFIKTEAAAVHLKAIETSVQKAFAAAATNDEAFQALGLGKEMQQWLDKLAAEDHYLMVRSTGSEDTKKSANAGGNISVAYVKPTKEEFCEALGQVVGSYFGAGSLQNRLNAETNPFAEDLKLAVTAQKMIGEPIGGAKNIRDIPISLVLFTNEPLYFGEEEFRAMRISATFGHGEGVVGNQGIGSDTVLVLQSVAHPEKILYTYDSQSKPERLAPALDPATGKVTLQKMANPPELIEAHALSSELIQRLYEWGVVGEKFFDDYPTDMEIVIKSGKIYPVQARPIVRPTLLPNYLDPKMLAEAADSPVLSIMKLEMIVPGKASVVELSRPEELATADILESAEKQFDKKVHKLVVVGQSEPSNSHPVVNFSSMGIPCLWTPKLAAAQELAKQITGAKGIAVCVQSAQIFLWDKSKGPIADYVKQGYVIHPAKISHSLPIKAPIPDDSRIVQALPEELHDTLFRLQTAVSRQAALHELQALRTSMPVQALQAKISELELLAANELLQAKTVGPTLGAAKAVYARLGQAFDEIEALLAKADSSGKMEFLLHVKILDALLFQTKETATGIAQHSLTSLQSAFAATDALVDYQRKLDQPARFADLLMDGTQSPVDGFFEEWQNFLLELEGITPLAETGTLNQLYRSFSSWISKEDLPLTVDEAARFKDVLQTMRRMGTLPLFATFFFGGLKTDSAVETLRAINELIPPAEEPRIQQLLSYSNKIAQLRKDSGLFGDPKAAAAVWERLQAAIIPFLPPQNSWMKKTEWDALSPITRSIAVQTMNELVDVYDLSIKSMKASPYIAELDKVREFKKMLLPYFHLLQSWAQGTVESEGFVTHRNWPLSKYFSEIETILAQIKDDHPAQLQASRGFSVSAAALGSGIDFQFSSPQRLEDVFTLIHQNLLATTSAIMKSMITDELMQTATLPTHLSSFLRDVPQGIGGEDVGQPQRIGIEVNQQGITFHYNVPLRNHSGKFKVNYDRQSKTLSMESQFLGQARERWAQVVERAYLLNGAGILPLKSIPKLTLQEVSLAWDISTQEAMQEALKEYQAVARMSMGLGEFRRVERVAFIKTLAAKGDLRKAVFSQPDTPSIVFKQAAEEVLIEEVLSNPADPLNQDLEFIKLILQRETDR